MIGDLRVDVPAGADVASEALSQRAVSRIELEVARRLFGRRFPGWRELDAYVKKNQWDDPENRAMRLSEQTLPLFGIGEDCFFLNEGFPDGVTLSDFTNLLEWDRSNHDVQEKYRVEEGHIPEPRPYKGRLMWEWARWLDRDGGMVYGNLSCAKSDVVHAAGEHFETACKDRYRTEFVDGPENGKKVGNLVKWDMLELPKDAATLRWACTRVATRYVYGVVEAKVEGLLEAGGDWLARTRREDDGERNEILVFSGPASMKAARFRSWLSDLAAMPDGSEELAAVTATAVSMMDEFAPVVFAAVEAAAAEWAGSELPHSSTIADRAVTLMGVAAKGLAD